MENTRKKPPEGSLCQEIESTFAGKLRSDARDRKVIKVIVDGLKSVKVQKDQVVTDQQQVRGWAELYLKASGQLVDEHRVTGDVITGRSQEEIDDLRQAAQIAGELIRKQAKAKKGGNVPV